MQVKNIEPSLRKTLTLVFKKQGLSDAAAAKKAQDHLSAAVVEFDKAQTKSTETRAAMGRAASPVTLLASRQVGGKRNTTGGKGKDKGKAKPTGIKAAAIKSKTSKVTSAEQVALLKARKSLSAQEKLASKTGASIAIALGAVAKWARTLR